MYKRQIYSKIKAGADVNCDEAWKLCTGDPRVIVAVVDDCVQWDHPDLAANMWTNTAELNGSEGRDDDSNGYADDIHGFNFVDNTTLTISTKGDAPDHGTHVAGTVAAVNNNGTGVAGIAGGSGKNDGVKIMSCQIFHDKDGGDAATSAKAIKYAADNGAAIIQCSYGYPAGSVTSDAAYSSGASAEKQAIDYFIAKQNCAAIEGGLAIFAAGSRNVAAGTVVGVVGRGARERGCAHADRVGVGGGIADLARSVVARGEEDDAAGHRACLVAVFVQSRIFVEVLHGT
mgnify:CR=1 FL=1